MIPDIRIRVLVGKAALSVTAGIPVPPGTFSYILHDYEANDGLVRIGMPEVLSMYLNKYTELTSDWQWFWFKQMVHAYTGYAHWDLAELSKTELVSLKAKWRSLTKKSEAFTNFKGTDIFRDYVSPNNLSGLPGQEPLVCCGNIVKILGPSVRLTGAPFIPVETLDGTKPPPDISKVNRLTRPDLIPLATNVAAIKPLDSEGRPVRDSSKWRLDFLSDGTWRVNPFPQLAPRYTPFPLRTNGREAEAQESLFRSNGISAPAGTYSKDGINYAVNYIRANRLEPLTAQTVPNPFNPEQ